MPNDHNHGHVEPLRQPGGGEHRHGVLHQGAITAQAHRPEPQRIPQRRPQLAALAHFRPDVVVQANRPAQWLPVGRLVLRRYVCEAVREMGRAFTRMGVVHVERLMDIGHAGGQSQHFARPGGARAVRAGDENGLIRRHSGNYTSRLIPYQKYPRGRRTRPPLPQSAWLLACPGHARHGFRCG